MLRILFLLPLLVLLAACSSTPAPTEDRGTNYSTQTGPLRLAIFRLTHDHAHGPLWNSTQRQDIQIVAIFEPDKALFDRYASKYNLDPSLRYDDPEEMLDNARPEAVSVMTCNRDHVAVARLCAPRGIHMLFEKPLAYTAADANKIAGLANKHGVLALTNYETSWYASIREAQRLLASGQLSPIRRLNFRHGHRGPREIGCSEEFLAWLTDYRLAGGGAIVDFGCYGAVLSTWLMNGQRPTSVVASASTLKPDLYPIVDDDATIILTYPTATAVIQASWCWTHDNKEMDVYTDRGSIHAGKWNDLAIRDPNQPPRKIDPTPNASPLDNEWTYLREVVRGRCPVDPLSSIDFNIIVAEILEAARNWTRRSETLEKLGQPSGFEWMDPW
ncbi:MAG: Gfo/Idh/MocA family oxidoreductase [Phycisphaerales bacterium]|nr:Gfo/Idh/MocA family oxidoreductase [Phycisphaerales bacterium]